MQSGISQENLAAELVKDLIKEKRSEKRWRNIRFFIGLLLILTIIGLAFSGGKPTQLSPGTGTHYISLIRLQGMIGPDEDFSSENVIPILEAAFKDKESQGVILNINSGGGTPVQASIIHDAILSLKQKYQKKIIVVGEDMLASGAYFVAVAADKIYTNPNTITGSIGVVMKGFGFPEVMQKIGIERRVYKAGIEKDRLDPFLPQNAADIEKIDQVIGEVHQNFINVVMQGRKNKLTAPPEKIFTGDFWSGESALKLGLIDGLGNLRGIMQAEFHVDRFKDYSPRQSVIKTIMGSTLNTFLGETSRMKVLYQ